MLHVVQPRVAHGEAVLVAQHAALDPKRKLPVEDVVGEQIRREVVHERLPLLAVLVVQAPVLKLDDEAPLFGGHCPAKPLLKSLGHVLHFAISPAVHSKPGGERGRLLWKGRQSLSPYLDGPILQPVHRVSVRPHEIEVLHSLNSLPKVLHVVGDLGHIALELVSSVLHSHGHSGGARYAQSPAGTLGLCSALTAPRR